MSIYDYSVTKAYYFLANVYLLKYDIKSALEICEFLDSIDHEMAMVLWLKIKTVLDELENEQ